MEMSALSSDGKINMNKAASEPEYEDEYEDEDF
jgi:hypothetical protein